MQRKFNILFAAVMVLALTLSACSSAATTAAPTMAAATAVPTAAVAAEPTAAPDSGMQLPDIDPASVNGDVIAADERQPPDRVTAIQVVPFVDGGVGAQKEGV